MNLDELLKTQPGSGALEQPARRAATAALQRHRASEHRVHWWQAMAAATALAGLAWLMLARAPQPVQPEPTRTQMHWTLSDGTKVHWTFDEKFALD